ncbi:hypothetical protein RZO07_11105 [Pseudomonas protegens]|uniref:hypothetical protein n=1 Tax=Pseudomonas protegens TaxID=380021 RepID=UPI002937244D|nr:hypothetical protein [Pseudomonas protegens]WOE81729.1 hypothetical protein RZO07_11105 [Pseudomonas protegens]
MLETACNGLPDLMTSARGSAGEHDLTYYRYDGKAYLQVYAYSREFVGSDAHGNDLIIARGGAGVRMACH